MCTVHVCLTGACAQDEERFKYNHFPLLISVVCTLFPSHRENEK